MTTNPTPGSTVQEVYTTIVRQLSSQARLQLAALILNDLAAAPQRVDYSGEWTEEDMRDMTRYSMQIAAARYPEDDDLT